MDYYSVKKSIDYLFKKEKDADPVLLARIRKTLDHGKSVRALIDSWVDVKDIKDSLFHLFSHDYTFDRLTVQYYVGGQSPAHASGSLYPTPDPSVPISTLSFNERYSYVLEISKYWADENEYRGRWTSTFSSIPPTMGPSTTSTSLPSTLLGKTQDDEDGFKHALYKKLIEKDETF